MLRLLDQLNYTPPNLKLYKKDSCEVIFDDDNQMYRLFIDGVDYMSYKINDHDEAYELYSHYDLAKGHCICTGLGFGVRENWLLTKKEVSKVTVLEKNKAIVSDVSEYLKASRNYQVEFGLLAKSTIDLGNYAEIKGCEKTKYEFCKSVPSVDYSKTKKDSWYSRLGNYLITIKNGNQPISNEKYLLIKATPTQKKYSHLTIEGCHYFLSGKLKIKETDYFMNINPILLLRYFNLYKIPPTSSTLLQRLVSKFPPANINLF